MVWERLPEQVNICSVRLRASFTGRFTNLAAIGANNELAHVKPFDPNPPPINGDITLTLSFGIPNMIAMRLRSPKTDWVESYTISWSPSHSAMVACGSIGLW